MRDGIGIEAQFLNFSSRLLIVLFRCGGREKKLRLAFGCVFLYRHDHGWTSRGKPAKRTLARVADVRLRSKRGSAGVANARASKDRKPKSARRAPFRQKVIVVGVGLAHENSVHYSRMKNVTLSADENLIEQARLVAKAQHKTLNTAFREWLEQFTRQSGNAQEFDSLMKRLKHVRPGRRFTRDEMNER
jgi:hypothetical protein